MNQRNRSHHNSQKRKKPRPNQAPPTPVLRQTPAVIEVKPPVQYGKPFIIMEDSQKQTFVYKSGSWVAYGMTIAQCRQACKVQELPQKVNRMTRYEVRCPLDQEPARVIDDGNNQR